jgi:lipoprotein-anchoring transpeptidase ErfK/SrfK
MPYWNGLAKSPDGTGNNGYGIHGLPCFNRSCTLVEGASHIGTPVSHGCVRLPAGGDAYIYSWAPIGTPVVIEQ